MTSARHAHVIGLGLIGASVALALRAAGWTVTGEDLDADVAREALAADVVLGVEPSPTTELVVVATPAGAVAPVAAGVLGRMRSPELIVTDVAGVKEAIAQEMRDPRFLGGHPMAGSELRGLTGARADLFQGCTWVLTPTASTPVDVYTRLHGVLREIGANVVAISAGDHDRLVALASHVPHLLAGALMNQAAEAAREDAVLLQLAAGGFRDMTRIAAGDPAIWPDVLFENRDAVCASLDALQERLEGLRVALANRDRDVLERERAGLAHGRIVGADGRGRFGAHEILQHQIVVGLAHQRLGGERVQIEKAHGGSKGLGAQSTLRAAQIESSDGLSVTRAQGCGVGRWLGYRLAPSLENPPPPCPNPASGS